MASRFERYSISGRPSILFNDKENSPAYIMKNKIKLLEQNRDKLDIIEMMPSDGAVVHFEQVLINRKVKKVRKVYLLEGNYKVGWIVDRDVTNCMICDKGFNWFGSRRHHCRNCGHLVCSKCSPYVAEVEGFEEKGGSRVCTECFGLKSNVIQNYVVKSTLGKSSQLISPISSATPASPSANSSLNTSIGALSSAYMSPADNIRNSFKNRNSLTPNDSRQIVSHLEIFEAQQMPKYRESYE